MFPMSSSRYDPRGYDVSCPRTWRSQSHTTSNTLPTRRQATTLYMYAALATLQNARMNTGKRRVVGLLQARRWNRRAHGTRRTRARTWSDAQFGGRDRRYTHMYPLLMYYVAALFWDFWFRTTVATGEVLALGQWLPPLSHY